MSRKSRVGQTDRTRLHQTAQPRLMSCEGKEMTGLFLLSYLAVQSVFTRVAWWSRQMADRWSLSDKVPTDNVE